MVRVLFVEPFYGGSHKAFLDGLVRHSKHEFELLTLPEGEWRRRMRRGAQELAARARESQGDFDLLVATDMLDLSVFLALTRPRFADVPALLYFHESQFTYPRIRGTKLNSWFGQINYLSACAADSVAFNSEFHRQEFLGALRTLAGQPNNWLVEAEIGHIEATSEVLPVGVDFTWIDEAMPVPPVTTESPLVLWNSRWEFDKAPDMFARAMLTLADEGVPFRLALCGDPGVNPHPAMADLAEKLGSRVVQFGLAKDRRRYAELLHESRIVVSTARHEFFGIGMVEAMYAGCLPIAPAGLNYPSLVPEELHDRCLYRSEAELVTMLRRELREQEPVPTSVCDAAARYAWPLVASAWDARLEAANSSANSRGTPRNDANEGR